MNTGAKANFGCLMAIGLVIWAVLVLVVLALAGKL